MSRFKKLQEMFNKQDEEKDFSDDEMQDNIILKQDKGIKKKIQAYDGLRSDMKKYEGRTVSYEDYQNMQAIKDNGDEDPEDEEIEEDGDEDEIQTDNNEEDEVEEQEDGVEEEQGNIDEDEYNDKVNVNNTKELFESSKNQMEKEDQDYLKEITKFTPSEIRKGKNVKNQKNLFEFFIGLRIGIQKILTGINSLPRYNQITKYIDDSNVEVVKLTLKDLFKLLFNIIQLQKELLSAGNLQESLEKSAANTVSNFSKILKMIKSIMSSLEDDCMTVELNELMQIFNAIFDKILMINEKVTNVWYRKSLVNTYKSNTKILKILNNDFCEHIKSNLNSNYETIRQATKKKANDRLLGRKIEFDDETYNDQDFYNHLLKEYIASHEEMNEMEHTDDKRYDLTMKYLMNKTEKQKKNVDTKASKNRKLRYDKYEKLINFTVPMHNSSANPGRDELIRSIFGMNLNVKRINAGDLDDGIEII